MTITIWHIIIYTAVAYGFVGLGFWAGYTLGKQVKNDNP